MRRRLGAMRLPAGDLRERLWGYAASRSKTEKHYNAPADRLHGERPAPAGRWRRSSRAPHQPAPEHAVKATRKAVIRGSQPCPRDCFPHGGAALPPACRSLPARCRATPARSAASACGTCSRPAPRPTPPSRIAPTGAITRQRRAVRARPGAGTHRCSTSPAHPSGHAQPGSRRHIERTPAPVAAPGPTRQRQARAPGRGDPRASAPRPPARRCASPRTRRSTRRVRARRRRPRGSRRATHARTGRPLCGPWRVVRRGERRASGPYRDRAWRGGRRRIGSALVARDAPLTAERPLVAGVPCDRGGRT